MQWHKWLTTCTGAPPLRPHFYQRYRFFDRLKHPVLSGCLLLFMLYFTRLRVCEISLFDLRSASAPYQCAVAVIKSELFINCCDVIHIDDIAPVASEKSVTFHRQSAVLYHRASYKADIPHRQCEVYSGYCGFRYR